MSTQTTESTAKSQKSKKVFTTLASLLGLQTDVKDKVHNNKIILNVSTDEPGRLIGRKGSSLDSMRLIMDRILQREEKGFPNIIIDVEGYEKKPREKRNNKRNNDRRGKRNEERNEAPAKAEKEEAPKTDVKIDPPVENKEQAPKTEQAKAPVEKKEQTPKQEAPKAEAPKAEEAKTEQPKTEAPAEKKEEAKSEQTEAPKTEQPKTEAKKDEKPQQKKKKPTSRIEQQCRNAAKEAKRWGEVVHLPPMPEAECFKALDYFKADEEIIAEIDEEKSFGAKKRVKLSLKDA